MMVGILLAAQAQWVVTPVPARVGDTVRLEREVAVEIGAEARLEPLEASAVIEPLGEPLSRVAEGRLRVWYRVAPFDTGRRAVAMPDIELILPDNTVRTVFGDTAWIEVASVLPAGDTLPPPRASLGPIARPPTTPVPLIALLAGVGVVVAAWVFARRRVRQRPPRTWDVTDEAEPPLDRWASAGELRAVAATVADRLRDRIAQFEPRAGRHLDTDACLGLLGELRPEWPLRDLGSVLQALERARFAPAVPGDTVILVDEAKQVLASLGKDVP
jgi:hypothetical protein